MKTKVTSLYMVLGVILTTCILISNIIAAKMVQIGPWTLTAGVLIFPLTYILDNLITEVYGFKAARFTMWCSFSMNLLMVIVFMLAIAWPAPVWFANSEAFATVLGSTPRLLASGLIGFVLGSYINSMILVKMKLKTVKGEKYALRAILSTLVGQTVDSCIFIPCAFFGTMPIPTLIQMIILQVLFKTGYEFVILPIESRIVAKVKNVEGLDSFGADDFNLLPKFK